MYVSSSSSSQVSGNTSGASSIAGSASPATSASATTTAAPTSNQTCQPQNVTVGPPPTQTNIRTFNSFLINISILCVVPSACGTVPGGLGRLASPTYSSISTRVPFFGWRSSCARSITPTSKYVQLLKQYCRDIFS